MKKIQVYNKNSIIMLNYQKKYAIVKQEKSKEERSMIAIGSDHGGYKLKEEIKKYLEEIKIECKDFGTDSEERTDYPIYAEKVAKSIQKKECDKGILLCKSGCGMAIVANKFKGIRAGLVINENEAKFAKADDDINVITISGNNTSIEEAIKIIRMWLGTEFKGGRYQERIEMINKIEKENMK